MPQTAGFARTLASRLVGATLLALLCFGLGRTLDARSAAPAPTGVDLTRSVADLIRHGDREISSTAIRQALSVGNPREAAAMLGHWHRIDGEVIGLHA